MKSFLGLLLFTSIQVLAGCKGNDPASGIVPANLTLDATVNSDGSGLVTFHVTADRANSYTVYFGEGNSLASTDDGMTSHTYGSSGTFEVKAFAYSVDNLSITKQIEINVVVNDPPIDPEGYSTPISYEGMTLLWGDEFEAQTLDLNSWNYETGGNGWGNNELEYYQQNNTSMQDGYLIINAKQEVVDNRNYSSSRLTTQNKHVFQNGRIDIRAKLPKGKGIWPALWLLGSTIPTAGWPACGEIDIMEMIGGPGNEGTVYGTAHWEESGHASEGGQTTVPGSELLADKFHVYSLVRNETSITWYLDDVSFKTIAISDAQRSELKNSAFLIFNVAVGGTWPGNPDQTTVFPQRMLVDYVRIFQ